MVRFYLVPVIGTGTTTDSRRPKYIAGVIAGPWSAMDYGDEPVMLVAADVTPGEHTTIAANADVAAAPADISTTISGTLSTVQTKYESFNIPADWVTSGMTWKTLIRWTSRLFVFHQRFQGLSGGRFFPAGITLSSLVGDLTAGQKSTYQTAASTLGVSLAGISNLTTIREALKLMAPQLNGADTLGGVAL